jgi:hypothetical protein
MLQPVSKVLLSVILLCVLYATTTSARALGGPASEDATQLSPIDDDDGAAQLTCGGHVCLSGQQCCSCRVTPSSPLTFFCHTPDYCPHGSICQTE